MRTRNIPFALRILAIFIIIANVCVMANVITKDFEGVITSFLCGYGIDYDNASVQEATKNGMELAEQIESKGAVLLKNENHSLPLQGDKKVNVFGWGGCDNGFLFMGGGSGEGSNYGRTALYAGLKEAGVAINEELASAYNALSYRRHNGYSVQNSDMYRLYEPDESFYSADRMQQAKAYSSNAIIVITRYGQEGTDWPKCQYDTNGNIVPNGRTFAQLSEGEELLISKVCETFADGNVVVLLNTANAIEGGFLNDARIDGVLFIGMPGSYGSIGVGRILTGEVNPSGKLADTYAYDMTTAPTFVNAGSNGIGRYSGSMQSMYPNSYIDYAEGIYVGYRWYETANEVGFWNDVNNEYGTGYKGVVQYPFGYGLSYANFSWLVSSVSIPNNSQLSDPNAEIVFKVVVSNESDVYSGSDVVELYYQAPYYAGEIEKSSICLGAFAKTGVLEPGQTEELTLKIKVRDMASYDCYDANNNGFMGYELDAGTYKISLRSDVHTLKTIGENLTANYTYTVPAGGYRYDTDERTGNKVENRFTNYTNYTSGASSTVQEYAAAVAYSIDGSDGGQGITYLSRLNFRATMPQHFDSRDGGGIFASCARHEPFVNPEDQVPLTGSKATSWKLTDMGGVDYDDAKWDELISQMSVDELALISARGGYTAVAVASVGKPAGVVCDGPSGLNSNITSPTGVRAITYPCQTIVACTWDWKEAYKLGLSIGAEADALGILQWYGPGLNTHRSPFGGRNFEYFSEDPILAGQLCAKEIQGAKEKGLAAYVKHFAANDSDTGRNGEYRWLTEQAMREIYLKPFEIAVKTGGCNAMMTSVDRVGSTRAAGSYAMCTLILRNEWGFIGSLVTDYYQGGNVHDADENIRAGNDMQLDPNGQISYFRDRTSGTAIQALQRAAKNQLYTYVDCKYTQATATGEDLSSVIVDVKPVFAWWKVVLYVSEGVLLAGFATWTALAFIGKKQKEGQTA